MRCEPARDFSVGKAIAWRSSIDDDPTYQRAGEVWSLAQRQLFIDSLLNGYDVPKIYLHDLRGQHPTKVYAVVDGKQRLTTLWSFVRDGFPLAPTFRIESSAGPDGSHATAEVPDAPVGRLRFSELGPRWRAALLRTPLSVVLIRDATEGDIEELFSRLNNGVALSAAERRNALGGAMAGLVREVAATSRAFAVVAFGDERGDHLELAARLLAREDAGTANGLASLDESPAGLDAFVRGRREMAAAERAELMKRLERRWATTDDLFTRPDPLLSSPSAASEVIRFAWQALDDDSSLDGRYRLRTALDARRRALGGAHDASQPDGTAADGTAPEPVTALGRD